jgi:hypothetical protein
MTYGSLTNELRAFHGGTRAIEDIRTAGGYEGRAKDDRNVRHAAEHEALKRVAGSLPERRIPNDVGSSDRSTSDSLRRNT